VYICLCTGSRLVPGQKSEAEEQGCGELAGWRKLCLFALHAAGLAEPLSVSPVI